MSTVQEIDNVLQSVRRVALHYGLASDGALGQQILLLGDSFYGYRFTAREYTAVWSASDQTLKIFDQDGRCLGNTILNLNVDLIEQPEPLRLSGSYSQRKAA